MHEPDHALRFQRSSRQGDGRPAPSMRSLTYALITPARNEAQFIERTLESVVSQTQLPIRWIVVSDGSTDGTDELVQQYVRRYAWIELLRLETSQARDFASKARAFNAGHQRLRGVPYDIIGNLDADRSFDPEYFAFLLDRFAELPNLGVAGTPFLEDGEQYDYRFTNIDHVSGGCQLFRRECFEGLAGYVPVERGGIDWIAVTTARMNGWQTRTFLEKVCVHHRRMGSSARPWEPWFRRGEQDYALGNHAVWQLARSVYQSASRPYVIRGLMLLSGYLYGFVTRAKRPISNDLLRFHRAEQLARLRRVALRYVRLGSRPTTNDTAGDRPKHG
jgi:biofilm PGA synthesis N-glycosyltransferase PgaC